MISGLFLHYSIIEKLGEGGMGEVYLATDTKLDRRVALKFLPPSLQMDTAARERLLREAKAASKLNHPNILTIHAVEQDHDRDFIVMEYVPGKSLSEFCDIIRPSIDTLVGLIAQVAEGLGHAHRAGVVHRDLKPANIQVDHDGRPRILDFGLAKFEGAKRVTQTGTTAGTIGYLSPEQIQGAEADLRSDIFSLGVMLYETVTGRHPFASEHDAAVLYSIVHEAPAPLAEVRPDVPAWLQGVTDRALAKDPQERYQSASEMIADLRAATSSSHPAPRPPRKRTMMTRLVAAAALTVFASAYLYFAPPLHEKSAVTKRIVVLPFDNLGSADDDYLALGISDEIAVRLASLGDLGVISRTSAMKFKASDKPLPEIAKELGVDFVLEGTIRCDRGRGQERVRITPQLIRVQDDTRLWTDTYEGLLDGVFDAQAEIANRIAGALSVNVSAPARKVIESRPTENMAAYQAYLRGIDFASKPDRWALNIPAGLEQFQQAVDLDSNFALAFARLSTSHSRMHHWGFDQTEARLQLAYQAAMRSLELDPNLPHGHLALGYYHYWGHRAFKEALIEFGRAAEGMPNSSEINYALASVYRRQGRLEEALVEYDRTVELDPLNVLAINDIAITNDFMRRYTDEERSYDRSIAVSPNQVAAWCDKHFMYIRWRGDTASARLMDELAPEKHPEHILEKAYIDRDYAAALEVLKALPDTIWKSQWYVDVFDYEQGRVLTWLNQPDEARSAFESARAKLEGALVTTPDDHRLHSALGLTLAGLGRKEDAIREGMLGMQLMPLSKDALIGTYRLRDMATIYTMVGEYDLALDLLDKLLSIPSRVTVPILKLYPTWDPLRDHPRFQALLKRGHKVF